jgi:RNA polymerase sigma-70 factor (ECF subfamily)
VTRATQDARAARMRAAVEHNADDLLAYFSRRASPIEDAADLLGETMVVVWRRIADLPADETKARMWMFGVARRVLSNYRRGRLRQSELAVRLRDDLRVQHGAIPFFGEAPDVWTAVDRLPEAQRELVLLVHGDGFTVTEAARLMGVPASTTRSRYAAALRTLELALTEEARTRVLN